MTSDERTKHRTERGNSCGGRRRNGLGGMCCGSGVVFWPSVLDCSDCSDSQ
jgi:hypothetical protein